MGATDQTLADKDKKGCMMVNICTELLPEDAELHNLHIHNQTQLGNTFLAYLKQGQKKAQIPIDKDLKALASLYLPTTMD